MRDEDRRARGRVVAEGVCLVRFFCIENLEWRLHASVFFFFSSRRRHTRLQGDWSSDVCSSDLLYARARYYDPASGQFISRDPVEGEARLPITWGAYQYCRYNPYRYVDPNGEQ